MTITSYIVVQLTTVEAAHCYWKSCIQLYKPEIQNSKLLLNWTHPLTIAISVKKWEKGVLYLINRTTR